MKLDPLEAELSVYSRQLIQNLHHRQYCWNWSSVLQIPGKPRLQRRDNHVPDTSVGIRPAAPWLRYPHLLVLLDNACAVSFSRGDIWRAGGTISPISGSNGKFRSIMLLVDDHLVALESIGAKVVFFLRAARAFRERNKVIFSESCRLYLDSG